MAEKTHDGYREETKQKVLEFMKKEKVFTISKIHRGIKPRPDWNSLRNIMRDLKKEKVVKTLVESGDRTYYKYLGVKNEDSKSKT